MPELRPRMNCREGEGLKQDGGGGLPQCLPRFDGTWGGGSRREELHFSTEFYVLITCQCDFIR